SFGVDAWQNPALHNGWFDTDRHHSQSRPLDICRACQRWPGPVAGSSAAVYLRESHPGIVDLDRRQDPIAGYAIDRVYIAAFHIAVGFYVSIRGHAGCCAMARRSPASHTFYA